MTFSEAIESAPEGADFIAYSPVVRVWKILLRRSDGIWDIIAEAHTVGYDLIAAGISARGKSLWNAERAEFECGTVAQMLVEPYKRRDQSGWQP
jgi:hypothetical protein